MLYFSSPDKSASKKRYEQKIKNFRKGYGTTYQQKQYENYVFTGARGGKYRIINGKKRYDVA